MGVKERIKDDSKALGLSNQMMVVPIIGIGNNKGRNFTFLRITYHSLTYLFLIVHPIRMSVPGRKGFCFFCLLLYPGNPKGAWLIVGAQ